MYCAQAALIGRKALAMEVGEYSVLVSFVRSKIRNMKNGKKSAPFGALFFVRWGCFWVFLWSLVRRPWAIFLYARWCIGQKRRRKVKNRQNILRFYLEKMIKICYNK